VVEEEEEKDNDHSWMMHDDGDDGFEDAHEADPNSRYVDYTCATAWEYFINELEELLRRWEAPVTTSTTTSATTPSSSPPPASFDQKSLMYNERSYTLVRWRSNLTREQRQVAPHALEDGALDFDTRFHDIQRWFGLRDFIYVYKAKSSPRSNDGELTKSEAHMLLSALCIALHNCDLCIPALVPIGDGTPRPQSHEPFVGYSSVEGIIGYAPPSEKHQLSIPTASTILVPFSTRFDTSKTFKAPEAYKTLEGFIELFNDKLSCSNTPLTGGVGGSGAKYGFEMGEDDSLSSPSNSSSGSSSTHQLKINVQHTWQWETGGQVDGSNDWRSLISPAQDDHWGKAVQKV